MVLSTDASAADSSLSRRGAVTTLAAGFALAVQPIGAQTITTDTDGLVADVVQIPVADGTIPAYRASPTTGGPFPVVLVVQEIFGVHEHIRDVCRRFAKLGYLAIAPELYVRQGDVSKLADIGAIRPIVSKVPDSQVMADLDAAVKWAGAEGKGDTARLAITGFCWGGRIVWLYSAHSARLKAGVAWYGRLRGRTDPLHEKYPMDVASELKAPVLGLYGGEDTGIPMADVEAMQRALVAAKSSSRIHVYPDAPHGFFADYRDSYRAADAKDGWKRSLAWFSEHGVAPS